jgi:hypothetical protein
MIFLRRGGDALSDDRRRRVQQVGRLLGIAAPPVELDLLQGRLGVVTGIALVSERAQQVQSVERQVGVELDQRSAAAQIPIIGAPRLA